MALQGFSALMGPCYIKEARDVIMEKRVKDLKKAMSQCPDCEGFGCGGECSAGGYDHRSSSCSQCHEFCKHHPRSLTKQECFWLIEEIEKLLVENKFLSKTIVNLLKRTAVQNGLVPRPRKEKV